LRRSVRRAAHGERDLLGPKAAGAGNEDAYGGTHKMPRELELKVEIQPSAFQRLTGARAVDGIAIGRPTTQRLRTVYFDTQKYDLHRAGLSLRLRRQNGRCLQTVKADQRVASGLSNPIESEAAIKSDEPDLASIADKKIRRAVEKATHGSALHPVFETVVQRTTRTIEAKDSAVELALDKGEVRAGTARKKFREVELELKSGGAEGLLVAGETLLGESKPEPSVRSKAERGYRLAIDKNGRSSEPQRKERPVRIRRKDSCAEAFSAIFASVAHQIQVNRAAVLESDDPEPPHQLRVSLRRLRSVLKMVQPLVPADSLKVFKRLARDLGRTVGDLRDADVLISGIYAPIEALAPNKAGFTELHRVLRREREVKRDIVRKTLSGSGWAKLLLHLTLWPHMLEQSRKLERPVTKYARKILCKAWRKAAEYGSNFERLDGVQRHEMRKALKCLRYQAEFFAPLFAKSDTRPFTKRLKVLQDVFGYVNDVRMSPRLIEVQQRGSRGIDTARVAGYIVGYHEAQAAHMWRRADKAWQKLERAPRFWD
jgi:triphosphatase